jgi:hypothetical protein
MLRWTSIMPRGKYLKSGDLPSVFKHQSWAQATYPAGRVVRGQANQPMQKVAPVHGIPATRGGRHSSGLVDAVAALALPPDRLVVGERRRERHRAGTHVRMRGRPGRRGGGHRGHLHGRARAALVALAAAARRARPEPHLLLLQRRRSTTTLHHSCRAATRYYSTCDRRRDTENCSRKWDRRTPWRAAQHTYLLLSARRGRRSLEHGEAGGLEKQAEEGDQEHGGLEIAMRRSGGWPHGWSWQMAGAKCACARWLIHSHPGVTRFSRSCGCGSRGWSSDSVSQPAARIIWGSRGRRGHQNWWWLILFRGNDVADDWWGKGQRKLESKTDGAAAQSQKPRGQRRHKFQDAHRIAS